MFALPQDLLVCTLQRLTPTAEEADEAEKSLFAEIGNKKAELSAATAAMVLTDEEELEHRLKRIVVRHVLACALVCHSAHEAVRAWMQVPANQDTLKELAVTRIRIWQKRTDAIFLDVLGTRCNLARPVPLPPGVCLKKRSPPVDADGSECLAPVQDLAEGLFNTLREDGRLYERIPPPDTGSVWHNATVAVGPTPPKPETSAVARLHLRRPVAMAFVHILEEDAVQLLTAAMRARVFRMAEDEEEPSLESRDLIFCIKERMRAREQSGGYPFTWWEMMPIWSAIPAPTKLSAMGDLPWENTSCVPRALECGDLSGGRSVFAAIPAGYRKCPWHAIQYGKNSASTVSGMTECACIHDVANLTEQLAAAGPALELQLAIVQRLAARAGVQRFSGAAAKLTWQYVMLQAAALLTRASTPVRELILPQRVHAKRFEEGEEEEEEESEEEEEEGEEDEMAISDEDDEPGCNSAGSHEVNETPHGAASSARRSARISAADAQEDTEESDGEEESDVEEGDDCDARWDQEEGEWVLLPSMACFKGAADWLREGLRGRTPFYLGLLDSKDPPERPYGGAGNL